MSMPPHSRLLAPSLADLGGTPRAVLGRLHDQRFRAVQFSALMPGLRARELDQSARRDVLATLRRNELELAGIDLWIPAGHFLDAALVDRAVATTLASIELASELGRCPLSMTLPEPAEEDSTPYGATGALGEHAQRFGVTIADHALPVAARGSMSVGVDPAAWLGKGNDPVAGMIPIADRLDSVRLCDLLSTGLRGPIGDPHDGQLDVVGYAAMLSVVGYERPVVVDLRQWQNPWGGLEQTRGAWEAACAMP